MRKSGLYTTIHLISSVVVDVVDGLRGGLVHLRRVDSVPEDLVGHVDLVFVLLLIGFGSNIDRAVSAAEAAQYIKLHQPVKYKYAGLTLQIS